jgi:predicted RNA-binding Zn-ribbon protein involved in translation (DUF1610 family)
MNDNFNDLEEDIDLNETTKELDFKCPNCGEIHQDQVVFLCNTCDSTELIKKDGIYICPQCLTGNHNFLCMSCDSKEVKLKSKI